MASFIWMSQRASHSRRTNNRGEIGGGGGGSVRSKWHGCVATIKLKEHKSRFYIVRRCVMMLIRWNKYKITE